MITYEQYRLIKTTERLSAITDEIRNLASVIPDNAPNSLELIKFLMEIKDKLQEYSLKYHDICYKLISDGP